MALVDACIYRLHEAGESTVICLQEVDELLVERLSAHGSVRWSRRGSPQADGCALVATGPLELLEVSCREYPGHTGYLAQRAVVGCEGQAVVIYNTHLQWTPDGEAAHGQARHLARWVDAETTPTIVTGDFNSPGDSSTMHQLLDIGLVDTHPWPGLETASFEGVGRVRVDYILVRDGTVSAERPEPLGIHPLPSGTNPSDHVPLVARITFSGA